MSLIPNIFGKEDRYIGLLPLSFWIYYLYIGDYLIFSISQVIVGTFFLIAQVYRNKLDEGIAHKKIKNTGDFSNFIRENPLLFLIGILI